MHEMDTLPYELQYMIFANMPLVSINKCVNIFPQALDAYVRRVRHNYRECMREISNIRHEIGTTTLMEEKKTDRKYMYVPVEQQYTFRQWGDVFSIITFSVSRWRYDNHNAIRENLTFVKNYEKDNAIWDNLVTFGGYSHDRYKYIEMKYTGENKCKLFKYPYRLRTCGLAMKNNKIQMLVTDLGTHKFHVIE